MKRSILIALTLLTLASCQKEDITPDDLMDGAQVEVTTTINATTEVTRSGSSTYTGETLSLSVDYGSSNRYTSTDVKWTNNNGSWSTESDQVWKDSKTATMLYAYAPYQEGMSDLTAIPFSAQADQSGGTASSDLVGYATDSYIPTSATLDIPFEHVMSQVIFNVTYSTVTFPETDFTSTPKVSAVIEASYDATTATVTKSGVSASINPLVTLPDMIEGDTKATRTYTAIVSPQTLASGATLLDLGSVGGKNLRYQPSTEIELEGGYSYIFNLTITSTYALVLSSDVVVDEGWESSTDLGSGALTSIDIVYNSTDDYYYIYTLEGFKAFADLVNGSGNTCGVEVIGADPDFDSNNASLKGRLMHDIDLSTICSSESGVSWTPIGVSSSEKFTGTFDGGGYKVSGLYINNSSDYQGLFGYVSSATIKNVNAEGSVVAASYVGGIVGGKDQYSAVDISNCTYSGSVEGSGDYVGGIMGYCNGYYNCKISNCINNSNVAGNNYAGGIAGYSYSQGGHVQYCGNTGTVTANGSYAGGISGCNPFGHMNSNYNNGAITAKTYVGGIVGIQASINSTNGGYSTVTNNYNTGQVIGDSYVGGIAGYLGTWNSISYCYSSGYITANNNTSFGGISGTKGSSVSNCYYASNNIVSPTITTGTAMTTTEMKNGTFAAMLGSSYQEDIIPNINDGYPILVWQVATE